MRLTIRAKPHRLIDERVERLILRDLAHALRAVRTHLSPGGRGRLVVNDTVWYRHSDGKAKPLVANQAGFFSQGFQNALVATGRWTKEKNIQGQKIDAYGEFDCIGGASISVADLCSWLPSSGQPADQFPATFARTYGAFVQRSLYSVKELPPPLRSHAVSHARVQRHRVGVEFETGNIASSFRALLKLNLLFRLGEIDVGVFVTSNSKARAATAIWPASNRNGSFEELELRHWQKIIDLPILGIGFEPDAFCRRAPILRADGTLCTVVPVGTSTAIGSRVYADWQCPGESSLWHTPM